MSKWAQFDSIDAKALNQQAEALGAGNGDFEELPLGKYEVSLDYIMLKESKKGYPMMAARFTVLAGQYQGRKVFMNQLVLMGNDSDPFRVHTCNEFLRSLESRYKDQVRFDGLDAYDALITAVSADCEGAEYLLDIGDRKGYRTYHILERFASAAPTQSPNASVSAPWGTEASKGSANDADIPF